MFFSPEATKTFIKLTKRTDHDTCPKPFGEAVCVDLDSMDSKSRFQLISYETNNTAFFYDTVVLVEGDSEMLVFPHIARTIDPAWGPEKTSTTYCRVEGKGNIARYRDFFHAFGVRVCVIADLDCLIEGFDQLKPSQECVDTRARLLQMIDEFIAANDVAEKISGREIRDIQASGVRQQRFKELTVAITRYREGTGTQADVMTAEEAFFVERFTSKRRQVLEEGRNVAILAKKRELLALLRRSSVFVLERGSVEDYYPAGIVGPDKPSKALDFCARVRRREALLALCDELEPVPGAPLEREFSIIFSAVYPDQE